MGFVPFMEDLISCHILMHCSSLFSSYDLFSLCLSLPLKLIFIMTPKKSILKNNLISRSSSSASSSIPLLYGSMTQNAIRNLRRTFLYFLFMQNVKSFCLILQMLWYLRRLGLVDGSSYVNNQLPAPMCLYRSFTPTYTLSVPLCLSLLHMFDVQVSLLLRSLSLKYSMFHGGEP